MGGNKKDSDLVEVLSHDLRNPLVVILGQCEVAIDSFKDRGEEVPKHLEKILRAGHCMERILNLVRELRSLELEKKVLTPVPVEINPAIDEARFIFEKILMDKEITLNYKSIVENPIVMAEKVSFENQVLNNLISNAIKFSQKGGQIFINVEPLDDKIKMEIIDEGMGIPEKLIKKLFKPNIETTRKGTQGEMGTGFGMPLVKKYIELYKGEISITSKDIENHKTDHGTTITLILNKAKVE